MYNCRAMQQQAISSNTSLPLVDQQLPQPMKVSVIVTDMLLFPNQWSSGVNGLDIVFILHLVYKNNQPLVELMQQIVSCNCPTSEHTDWLSQLQCLWACYVEQTNWVAVHLKCSQEAA